MHGTTAVGNSLVGNAQCIAHAAAPGAGNFGERGVIEGDVVGGENVPQVVGDLVRQEVFELQLKTP